MAFTDGDDDRLADDGIQRDESAGLPPVERALGFILDEPDEKKVAKAVVKLREDQASLRSRNRATWQRNAWWREGRRGVRIKRENEAMWEASLRVGMLSAPPVPNKTDRLCRRVTNVILVDKPYPDCEPAGDNNEDRDSAEFSTRYLAVKGAPSDLNMSGVLRAASDKSHTYASTFGWVTMDPMGGGHRPRSMLAHPQATTTEDALLDPMTGQQAPDDALTDRFIRPDGYLSDDSREADLQWLPAPKIRLLTGLQLDLLPATSRGLADAVGVVITDPTTLGDLRKLFPDAFKRLSADQVQELCKWRPTEVKDVLPPFTQEPEDQKDERTGAYKDSQMVIVTTVYYETCAEYPYGCYAVIGGTTIVLHRQKWSAIMQGEDGEPTEECLTIPVSQARCLDDHTYDNPFGIGLAEKLGPADEIRHNALGHELEHMFRASNPIPFIPIGSIVQPGQFRLRSGEPVMVNPQGKPEWENVPALSSTIPELRQEMTEEMDDESGLQQAAQGVEAPSVQSGTHAQTIIQEALKAVANMKDNLGDFYISLQEVILQLSRAFCTVPQMLEYVGEDGAYKQREWSRTDFANTKRVTIAKGSYTMHTLLAKQEMANNAFDRQTIDAEEYQELTSGGISPILGRQDNPHLMRVRRQVEEWKDGPKDGWVEAMQQFAVMQQQMQQMQAAPPMVDAMGQPMPPQPPPVPPPQPFSQRLPIDLEPMAAKIRHRQLSRVMASTKYLTFPKEWQDVFQAEYAEMANAAGIITVPATQQAQAAEQEAQAKAAEAQNAQLAAAEQGKLDLEQQKLALETKKVDGDIAAKMQPPPASQTQPAMPARAIEHHRDGNGALQASTVRPMTATRINHIRDAAGRVVASDVAPMPS